MEIPNSEQTMETKGASAAIHYWGREFRKLGRQLKLVLAQYVNPFVLTHKNDANDAEAIVAAALRRHYDESWPLMSSRLG